MLSRLLSLTDIQLFELSSILSALLHRSLSVDNCCMNLNEVSCINLSSFCAYFTKFAIFCHLAPGDANLSALLHRVSNFGTFAPVQFPEQTKMQLLQISKIFTISTISIILSAFLAYFINTAASMLGAATPNFYEKRTKRYGHLCRVHFIKI